MNPKNRQVYKPIIGYLNKKNKYIATIGSKIMPTTAVICPKAMVIAKTIKSIPNQENLMSWIEVVKIITS